MFDKYLKRIYKIAMILAAIAIPLIVLFVGNSYNRKSQEALVSQKYVELAINILKDKPNDENKPIREYAVKLLSVSSPITIDSLTKVRLISQPIYRNVILCSDGYTQVYDYRDCPK